MTGLHRRRRATPIYRESGYSRWLPPVSDTEKRVHIVMLVLLAFTLLLILWARLGGWVEQFYSLGFYRIWSGAISALTRRIHISLAECLIIIFTFCCIVWLVCVVTQLVRYRRQRGAVVQRFVFRLLSLLSALLLLFAASGGLNYYRSSFTEYCGLTVSPASTEQLTALCLSLAEEANANRALLGDEVAQPLSHSEAWRLGIRANEGYGKLLAQNPDWQRILSPASVVRAKPVFFSRAMSYMQIVGVFFPYTIEANVNIDIAAYKLPNAICHELAHVAGFMREDEANYISYLACRAAEDPLLGYSGAVLALIHSTNALYGYDPAAYGEVMRRLDEPVLADLAADAAYWARFDTPFGDFSTAVNDGYLRANSQTDGVNSYGRMVDLLLADYLARTTPAE